MIHCLKGLKAVAVAAAMLWTAAVAAQPMQCPGGIVSVGDSEADVFARCGPPSSRQVWDQVRTEELESPDGSFSEPAVAIPQDEWIYDFGPTRFVSTVRFADGRVKEILTGGYGMP